MLSRFAAVALVLSALPAIAADAPAIETGELGNSTITLHLHSFLNEEELTLLRAIMMSKEALALFVPGDKGFAAISVAPDEGFVRDGVPPASVAALADFPDADTARAETLKICDAAKKSASPCVVIMEIAPK